MNAPRIEHPGYFSDSIFSFNKTRPFSTACVKFAKSRVLIFDFTQSSKSLGSVIDRGTRFLAMCYKTLHKHINIVYYISCGVLYNTQYNTMYVKDGDVMDEGEQH